MRQDIVDKVRYANGIEWLVNYIEDTNIPRPSWMDEVDLTVWGSLPRQDKTLREEQCTIISIKFDKLEEIAREDGLDDAKLAHGMLLNWVVEKLSGSWNMSVLGTFLFRNDNDAALFKMTWFG